MKKITTTNGTVFQEKFVNGYSGHYEWNARKNGFKICIVKIIDGGFYATVKHAKKDIRFNSLWNKLTWETIEAATEYMSEWKPEDHECLGADVPNQQPITT